MQKCELCGKLTELRPYGPKGENICFSCGRKDPKNAVEKTIQRLFGESVDSTTADKMRDELLATIELSEE